LCNFFSQRLGKLQQFTGFLKEIKEKFLRTAILSTYGSTALVGLGRFVSFLIYTQLVGHPWTGDQPVAMPLTTNRTTQA
jgi:uncharacterized membrane protein